MITENYVVLSGDHTTIRCRRCQQTGSFAGPPLAVAAGVAEFQADHDKAHTPKTKVIIEETCPVIRAEWECGVARLLNSVDLVHN